MADLPGCLESIESHAASALGSSIHVHIQDSASGDNLEEYLASGSRQWISLCSAKDSGIYDAMNTAVALLNSKWVYFMGADDRLTSDFTDAVKRLSDDNSIYYANVVKTSNNRIYDGKFNGIKLIYRNICQQAIFYPRKLLLEKPFSLKYQIQSDWAWNINHFSKIKYKYIDLIVGRFNNETGVSSTERDTVFYDEKNSLFFESYGILGWIMSASAPVPTWIYHKISGKKD